MGSVIDFGARRKRPSRAPQRQSSSGGSSRSHGPRVITCEFCGERHPIMRLQGGEERCVTAFHDGEHWFCRNRGCRRAWLERRR